MAWFRRREAASWIEVEAVVDWAPLRALLGKRGSDGAGNSSYPAEVLLRGLLAGIWHNLSDPALEAAIADRLSFRRFVGLSLHDRTPDHTTLWRFRQELASDGLIEKIFAEINRQLEDKKLILKQGTLVDASLIPARAKPPGKARKDAQGQLPKPSADRDARWGRKGKKSVFGYKIHTGVDAGHTIIRRIHMTDASVTDTEPADRLFCGDEKAVYGDQAYYTHARHARLTEAGKGPLDASPQQTSSRAAAAAEEAQQADRQGALSRRTSIRRIQRELWPATNAVLQLRPQPGTHRARLLRLQSASRGRRLGRTTPAVRLRLKSRG
ncbi:IS5 family transposase [Bradyrhizobium sp. LB7.1]